MTAAEAGPGGAAPATRQPRPIIVHYHLFKNAGTSVDRTLQANFGATWTTIERDPQLLPRDLRQFLIENPWVTAVSSHTAMLPLPKLPGISIIPIVFLRHPLDRIRSIYDFERRQDVSAPAPDKAKEVGFAGYVDWRLDRAEARQDHSIANFQTRRLARLVPGEGPLVRAKRAVEELPFVGLVEDYEPSLLRLQALLQESFPKVELAPRTANTTEGRLPTMEQRLAAMRADLGEETYLRVSRANALDMALWEFAATTRA